MPRGETRTCARPFLRKGPHISGMLWTLLYCITLPLLAFSLDASDVLARRSASCQRPSKFDEARLALQWSPGICYNIINKVCTVNVDRFTIHGLWPSRVGGNDPQNCCNKPFDAKLIKHLEPKLKVRKVVVLKEYLINLLFHHEGNLDDHICRQRKSQLLGS